MFAGFGNPTIAALSKLFSSSGTPIDKILARSDVLEFLDGVDKHGQKQVVSYVDKNLPRFLSAVQKQGSSLVSVKNASLIISRYIEWHSYPTESIRRIVPSTLGLLAKRGLLQPHVAQAFQTILLAAFEQDFFQTTFAINITLGDEIVHGAIRNISASAAIGETLLALFGSAVSPSTMMAPSTTPQIFTEEWIKRDFPFHLAAYSKIAMAALDSQSYFYFMLELVKRGLSHSSGPLVDGLLTKEVVGELFSTVVDACEQTDGSANTFPLAADGVVLLNSIISLLRRSMPPTENAVMYNATVEHYAPIDALFKYGPRLVGLLSRTEMLSKGFCPNGLGTARLAVCDMLCELAAFQLYRLDAMIVELGFPRKLFELLHSFPHNDILQRAAEKIILGVFKRTIFSGLTSEQHLRNDPLLNYFVYGDGFRHLLELREWSEDTELSGTSLQAFSFSTCYTLNDMILTFAFEGSPADGIYAELLQVRKVDQLRHWTAPITGKGYERVGSGCPGVQVHHRPVVNPGNISMPSSSSLLSTEEEPPLDTLHPLPIKNQPSSNRMAQYAVQDDRDPSPSEEPQGPEGGEIFSFDDPGAAPPNGNGNGSKSPPNGCCDDSDDVNIDDIDGDDSYLLQRRTSLSASRDEEWVEKTIQDVSDALNEEDTVRCEDH